MIVYNVVGADGRTTPGFTVDAQKKVFDLGQLGLEPAAVVKLEKVEVQAKSSPLLNAIDRKVYNVGKDIQSATGSAGGFTTKDFAARQIRQLWMPLSLPIGSYSLSIKVSPICVATRCTNMREWSCFDPTHRDEEPSSHLCASGCKECLKWSSPTD